MVCMAREKGDGREKRTREIEKVERSKEREEDEVSKTERVEKHNIKN